MLVLSACSSASAPFQLPDRAPLPREAKPGRVGAWLCLPCPDPKLARLRSILSSLDRSCRLGEQPRGEGMDLALSSTLVWPGLGFALAPLAGTASPCLGLAAGDAPNKLSIHNKHHFHFHLCIQIRHLAAAIHQGHHHYPDLAPPPFMQNVVWAMPHLTAAPATLWGPWQWWSPHLRCSGDRRTHDGHSRDHSC